MTADDTTWTPCRRHLFDDLSTIATQHRHRSRWRIPTRLWERIKRSPDFAGDWHEGGGFGGHPSTQTLLGQPVDLIQRGLDEIQIVLPSLCTPGKG
jgi:hypothetical protein